MINNRKRNMRRKRIAGSSNSTRQRNISQNIPMNRQVSVSLVKSPFSGMPDIFSTKLRYFENSYHFDLGTSDSILSQELAISNPYDPVYATGGKAANLFQQIGALYRYCRVNKTKVHVTYQDVSTGNTCPVQFALVLNNELVSYADMDDVVSLPDSRRRVNLTTQNRIGSTKVISGYFHPKDFFYMTQQQWDSQEPGSAYDVTNLGGFASPTKPAILSIIYSKIDQANTTAVGIFGSVTIDFEVTFKSLIPFPE